MSNCLKPLFLRCSSFNIHVSIFKTSQTSVTVLVGVSDVFHREAEHGLFGSKKLRGNNLLPVLPSVVDVDVDGSADQTVFNKELRCSNSEILPPANISDTATLMIVNTGTGRHVCFLISVVCRVYSASTIKLRVVKQIK